MIAQVKLRILSVPIKIKKASTYIFNETQASPTTPTPATQLEKPAL